MSFGFMAVDYEIRVDYDRLRKERLQRAKKQMKKDGLGALLCFDGDNIRYITSTHHPQWARGKMARWSVLPRGGEPILFEMGTLAAARRQSHGATWLKGRVRQAGTWGVEKGASPAVEGLKKILKEHGVEDEPIGVDLLDVPLWNALEKAKLDVVDGQDSMLNVRLTKTEDELELLEAAAAMVECGFDKVAQAIRPGVRENDLVGLMYNTLFSMGADAVINVQPTSGPRTNPHHHDFSDRYIRPGDIVMLDVVNSFNGYKTCYYRSFVCGRPTQEQKDLYSQCYAWLKDSIDIVRPGITTKDIVEKWPTARSLGFKNEVEAEAEDEALALEVGHGIGLGHWERPMISRTTSVKNPFPIKEGMVIALETYAGQAGAEQGVRIEEEVVVTSSGHEVITKYPVEELTVCGL